MSKNGERYQQSFIVFLYLQMSTVSAAEPDQPTRWQRRKEKRKRMVGIDHVRFLQDLRAKWEAILVSSLFLAAIRWRQRNNGNFFFQLKRLSNVLEMKIFSSTLPHNKKSRWSIHPPTSPRVHTCCVYSRVYTTITFRAADFFCLFNYRLMQSQKKEWSQPDFFRSDPCSLLFLTLFSLMLQVVPKPTIGRMSQSSGKTKNW